MQSWDRVMRKPKGTRDVVKLADLAPRHEVRGGNQQRVFGAGSAISEDTSRSHGGPTGGKKKDLTPKSSTNVKGGGVQNNDNLTLVRGAKPTKKRDLPARKDVKSGKKFD